MFDEGTSAHEAIKDKKDEEILFLSIKKPALFEVLINRYQTPFLNKVRSVLGHREEVEDIVQETFVKIYVNAGRFKVQEGASFKSWGYKILINTCFTKYKKLKNERVFLNDLDLEIQELIPSKADLDSFEQKLDTDYVLSVISKLTVILGRVLRLWSVEGKSQKDISKIEGISLGAVRARIHRAKKEIKRMNLHTIMM